MEGFTLTDFLALGETPAFACIGYFLWKISQQLTTVTVELQSFIRLQSIAIKKDGSF